MKSLLIFFAADNAETLEKKKKETVSLYGRDTPIGISRKLETKKRRK